MCCTKKETHQLDSRQKTGNRLNWNSPPLRTQACNRVSDTVKALFQVDTTNCGRVMFLSGDVTEKSTVKGHFSGIVKRAITRAFLGHQSPIFGKEHHASAKNCFVRIVEVCFHEENSAKFIYQDDSLLLFEHDGQPSFPSFWREAQVHRNINKDGVHFTQCVVFAYCLVMTKVQSRDG
jgi:hypothetical protein